MATGIEYKRDEGDGIPVPSRALTHSLEEGQRTRRTELRKPPFRYWLLDVSRGAPDTGRGGVGLKGTRARR